MNLSIGIVGLPNVGKSTLFNALTKQSVPAENYPFCTIDPSVGIVGVPDERLNQLSRFSDSEKTIPAAVEFTDIAGLVAGASKGEGLGNQFLAHIREVDAIAEVVRVFHSGSVTHVAGAVDPLRDIEVINLELILSDMQTVAKRRAGLVKNLKAADKDAEEEDQILARVEQHLEAGRLASAVELSRGERARIKHCNLLTLKPIVYIVNTDDPNAIPAELRAFFEKEGVQWTALDIATEQDVAAMTPDERDAMRDDFGEERIGDVVRIAYDALDLLTFFTTGPKETRAWTVRTGARAPEAGAAIHSDFQDKFIRADVIDWRDLLGVGLYAVAREKGLIRTEGKEYIVKDGDVMEFKI